MTCGKQLLNLSTPGAKSSRWLGAHSRSWTMLMQLGQHKHPYTFNASGHKTKVNCETLIRASVGPQERRFRVLHKAASTTETGKHNWSLSISTKTIQSRIGLGFKYLSVFAAQIFRFPFLIKKNKIKRDLLKAIVVPGVLEDFRLKRVLHFPPATRTVTTICTWRRGNRKRPKGMVKIPHRNRAAKRVSKTHSPF